MKIAILGGGVTGLAAAYYLQKKGHQITLFEKSQVLGGLAAGFKAPGWDWYLERAYHHLFANDYDILNFAKEIGFNEIFFSSPETASFYDNYRTFPLDTPQDLLKFPYLSFPQKIRAGLVLAFLKFTPFLPLYEKQSAQKFLEKYMGRRAYEILFKELFRKKFGKYAGNILTSFFWARITKRTKKLGYVKGGFQTLIDFTERKLMVDGVIVKKGANVENLKRRGERFIVNKEEFDIVISTLPSPILTKVAAKVLPKNYLERFKKLKFLHAVVLILETKKPLLEATYWLNICTDKLKVMGVMQHTNMVDKKHYGNRNILYAANYVDSDDPLLKMTDKEILNHYLPQLKKINENWKLKIENYYVFKAPWAQPIFDRDFLKNKPDFITPVKNFYIANLDMTYPYDRGTNYAVKLGREVASLL